VVGAAAGPGPRDKAHGEVDLVAKRGIEQVAEGEIAGARDRFPVDSPSPPVVSVTAVRRPAVLDPVDRPVLVIGVPGRVELSIGTLANTLSGHDCSVSLHSTGQHPFH